MRARAASSRPGPREPLRSHTRPRRSGRTRRPAARGTSAGACARGRASAAAGRSGAASGGRARSWPRRGREDAAARVLQHVPRRLVQRAARAGRSARSRAPRPRRRSPPPARRARTTTRSTRTPCRSPIASATASLSLASVLRHVRVERQGRRHLDHGQRADDRTVLDGERARGQRRPPTPASSIGTRIRRYATNAGAGSALPGDCRHASTLGRLAQAAHKGPAERLKKSSKRPASAPSFGA